MEVSAISDSDQARRRLLLGLLLLVCCLYSLLARDTYGSDFRAYYVAAQASHAGLDPYLNQVNIDERYADRDWLEVNSRFIYPPSSLLLFAPFTRLPYKIAKVVFSTSMALLMVWILMALRDRTPRATWIALGLFLSLPMAAGIDNGQVDVLILALTLAVLFARPAIGGVCLGIAIAIKLAPALVLLWLLATRRWLAAMWAVAAAAVLTAVALRLWGVGMYREFFDHLRAHADAGHTMLTHTFTTFQVIFGRFVVIGSDTYSLHYFYGTRQNPLLHLYAVAAPVGAAMVVLYLVAMLWSGRRRTLESDPGLYAFLVVALFANALLWPAGLVACFPLTMLLVERSSRPVEHGLIMLLPFFIPMEFFANRRFLFWLVAAAICIWQIRRDANAGIATT